MCIFGSSKKSPPPLPPPPPQTAVASDQDVARARADEQNRLRALAGSGSTLVTAGKDLDATASLGKEKLGA